MSQAPSIRSSQAPIAALLPLYLARIRLRLTAPVRLHFLHGGVVHGLLNRALGHDLPEGLVPFAPESGRVRFEVGDSYNLGVTLAGEARRVVEGLAAALERVGREVISRTGGPPVTLGGIFRVESVEVVAEVTEETIARLASAAAEREALTLRSLSPLRLERPKDEADGCRFLNGDYFPAPSFSPASASGSPSLPLESTPAPASCQRSLRKPWHCRVP